MKTGQIITRSISENNINASANVSNSLLLINNRYLKDILEILPLCYGNKIFTTTAGASFIKKSHKSISYSVNGDGYLLGNLPFLYSDYASI